jgi:predicted DNA-binding transcriptional regulator AlpA
VATELRLVGLAEVAKLLAVTKRTASRYAARDDFPSPVADLAMGPVWLAAEVEDWIAKTPIRRGRPPGKRARR